MVKSSKAASSLLAAAAAITNTGSSSSRSQQLSSSLCRQQPTSPSFVLSNADPRHNSFMRLCHEIPRGGDDAAATRDDTAEKDEIKPSAATVAASKEAAENETPTIPTASSSGNHGKKKKKRTRKKEKSSSKEEAENKPTTNSPIVENDAKGDNKKDIDSKNRREEAYKPKQTTASSSSSSSSSPQATRQQPAPAPASAAPSPPSPPKKMHSPIVEQILKEEDYYKILGILNRQEIEKLSSSSQDEAAASSIITKHYRKRALQTHPDKTGGDRRAFDKVAEAYDILSDPDKRNVYNRFGKKGLDGIGNGAGSGAGAASRHAEELFRSFFGAGPGNPFFQQQQQMQRSRRNQTARYQLPVTLEELYRGMTKSVLVAPPPELPEETMIFGNMIYRRPKPQQPSQKQQSKTVQVHVPRGALNGQNIILSGEMDFDRNETPGNIIFSLSQRPHVTFTRKGYDLAMQYSISLRQALCSQLDDVILIRHLNGQDIPLFLARRESSSLSSSSQQEQEQQQPCMIHDGDVQVVKGLGMPKDAQGTAFGDLYIQFKVTMPTSSTMAKMKKRTTDNTDLTLQERQELGRLLDKLLGTSASTSSSTKGDDTKITESGDHNKKKDVYIMKKASLADFGRASGIPKMPSQHDHDDHDQHHHPDDNDDDDHHGYQQYNPFGASQFFFSSSSMMGGPGGRSSFFGRSSSSSSNPFQDGHHDEQHQQDDHDENDQCRQM